MAPVLTAPFYAVKIERVTMGVPTAGLPIDVDGRVLDVSDQPIPGLYAAGNSAAWLDIGGGSNSGIANTRGLLYSLPEKSPLLLLQAQASEPLLRTCLRTEARRSCLLTSTAIQGRRRPSY